MTTEVGAPIEFRGVSKHYGQTVALASLDLRIEAGEFVSLLGPSGSGKTTTLNILAGLLAPDAGTVTIGDCDVTHVGPDRRDIAMVFQSYALYPHMTIAENLAFPLRARRRRQPADAIATKVRAVADTLGIGHLLERYPREVSGGQQQRVALGRAMVRDPKVFLLDEPLSNLDARLRLRMRHDLKALHQRLRSTAVYVTHDQGEAMSLSDRIAIYRSGVLQQFASPIEIDRRPVNSFVANFMGEREMNMVTGEIAEDAGRAVFRGGALTIALDPAGPWTRLLGRKVTLGIRPEGVRVGEAGESATVDARVRLIEHAGAEQIFFAEAGAAEFCGRVATDVAVRAGDTLRLTLPRRELYLFDTDSGATLVHAGEPAGSP
ncbi:MAG: ABC transporter ATP-binding protein [Alphaproteobacteria bacterium]|nr:ABC transporter ATP-binding protein [Alphaproteobacteria bacterium]